MERRNRGKLAQGADQSSRRRSQDKTSRSSSRQGRSASQESSFDDRYKSGAEIQQGDINAKDYINYKKEDLEQKINKLGTEISQAKQKRGEITEVIERLSASIHIITEGSKELKSKIEQQTREQGGLENKVRDSTTRCKDIENKVNALDHEKVAKETLKSTAENNLEEIKQESKELQEKLYLLKEQPASGLLGKKAIKKLRREVNAIEQEKEILEKEFGDSKKEDLKNELQKLQETKECLYNANSYNNNVINYFGYKKRLLSKLEALKEDYEYFKKNL